MSLYSKKAEKVQNCGSFKTTLFSVGFETEEGYEYVKKGQYGFSFGLSFGKPYNGNNPITNFINYPYFKISSDLEEKGNYLRNNLYKVDGNIQITLENVQDCISTFTNNAVDYMSDFLSVFCSDEDDKTKYQVAREKAYAFLRLAKTVNRNLETTPYYTEYGHYANDVWQSSEGNNVPEPYEKTNQKTGKPYYMGKYEDKDVYLSPVYGEDFKAFYRELNMEDYSSHIEDSDEQLEHQLATLTEAVNIWVFNFFEYCFSYVEEHNTGQVGYIYKTWQKNKKGDWYLSPVLTLKSLMVGKAKVNKNKFIYLNESADYPDAKFYYSNIGQVKYSSDKKEDGTWGSVLQFVFRDEPFNENMEGFDKKVSYRGNSNPLFVLQKPEVFAEIESDESENTEDIDKLQNEPPTKDDDLPF